MLTKEEYEAKRHARYLRLLNAAERADSESKESYAQSDRMSSVIPFGQPVLVGHYSEAADRRYRERIHQKMRKGWDLHEKADALRSRAEAALSNNTIFSDDPSAVEKLEDKIARLEKRQELMKAANKLVKKNDREGLLAMGFSETRVAQLFVPDFCGRIGFPNYEITNNGANIRRLKQRISHVQKLAAVESSEVSIGEVKIVTNSDICRLQVFFPGKPAEAVRSELKSHGFHWSPSSGAWQRMISPDASYWAEIIAKKYYS